MDWFLVMLFYTFELPESNLINDVLGSLVSNVRGLWLILFIMFSYFICLIPENNYRKLREKTTYLHCILWYARQP